MKERPILFSAPMVRAILDGSKTQTRRVVKPQCTLSDKTGFNWKGFAYGIGFTFSETVRNFAALRCPYGQPGDQLWVRETHYEKGSWIQHDWDGADGDDVYWSGTGQYLYAATDDKPKSGYRSWPSIHMRRKASRIQLEIVSVRVERLNDISQADAAGEGLFKLPASGRYVVNQGDQYFGAADHDPRIVFQWLWESINGADSWEINPWVWVVEFKRIQ